MSTHLATGINNKQNTNIKMDQGMQDILPIAARVAFFFTRGFDWVNMQSSPTTQQHVSGTDVVAQALNIH